MVHDKTRCIWWCRKKDPKIKGLSWAAAPSLMHAGKENVMQATCWYGERDVRVEQVSEKRRSRR
jgi:hypothetical protein